MAKNIQIKYINEQDQWEELYPASKVEIIKNEAGTALQSLLDNKRNVNESYSSVEIDQKITTVNNKIDGIETFDLPVSSTEPADSSLWFEII